MKFTYHLDDEETDKYYNFCSKHSNCYAGAIGGAVSVQFTETGLGLITVVSCSSCKEEENITNFEHW